MPIQEGVAARTCPRGFNSGRDHVLSGLEWDAQEFVNDLEGVLNDCCELLWDSPEEIVYVGTLGDAEKPPEDLAHTLGDGDVGPNG